MGFLVVQSSVQGKKGSNDFVLVDFYSLIFFDRGRPGEWMGFAGYRRVLMSCSVNGFKLL